MASFLHDLTRVATSNASIIICSVLISIITARMLGPEGSGIIAGLAVYPSLFMTFGSLGIRQSTTYHLGKNIFDEEKIKTAITQIWFLTSIVSIIVCYYLMSSFSSFGNNRLWVILALIPIPFSLFVKYNSGIFLGKNDIGTFNKTNWIPSAVHLLFIISLVLILKYGVTGALISMIFGPLAMSIILLLKNKFIQAFRLHFDRNIFKSLLSLGVVYAFALLVINLNYKVDIILLDKMSTSYELGIYSKGASLTQYLWQIPMVLSTIVFARSATSKDNKAFSLQVTQLMRISFLAITIVSIILFLLSNYVVWAMFGLEFFKSSTVIKYLLPGVIVLTIFKVMNTDLAGRGKPWIALKAMLPALFINVVLNIIYIPNYGSVGAAISSTVSYMIGGILFLLFYSKEVNIPIIEIVRFRKNDLELIFNLLKKIKTKYAR